MPGSRQIKITPAIVLFCLILLLGIFARVWEFASLPPGLNQDEASSGVDAFSLYRYGVDRNGVSFPVHFISWGSGQNALYAYIMIPFIALGGLTPLMVRLPMLIAGILSLPLLYLVARRTAGEAYALIAMFLLAISPWHILLSRWGLESNLLPFVFLAGYACLLSSRKDNAWFVPACLLFGLCLYAYGTAYVAVPFFLVCAIAILLHWKRVSLKHLAAGLTLLLLAGIPIGLFVLVNQRQMDSIHLGLLTIPRLPAKPRYETVSAIFSGQPLQALADNTVSLVRLLWNGSDGLVWNTIEPYGYFYPYSLLAAVIGAFMLLPIRNAENKPEKLLLFAWLAASVLIGMLQPVNINRINLIFFPLLLCVAAVLAWLWEHFKIGLAVAILILLVGFALFTRDYHGPAYRQQAEQGFFAGLLPALQAARQAGSGPICVTDTVNMPYIYALFSAPMNPADYLKNIKYDNPNARFRAVRYLDRYAFGLKNCPLDSQTIYILADEAPPRGDIGFQVNDYGNYQVYVPKIP